MGFSGKFESWKIQAADDLSNTTPGFSGALYKAVDINTGTFAASAVPGVGILQTAVKSGGHINVAISGISKGVFGVAVNTPGMRLTVATSGFIALASSGDNVIGRSLVAVDCAAVAAFMFNTMNPWVLTS